MLCYSDFNENNCLLKQQTSAVQWIMDITTEKCHNFKLNEYNAFIPHTEYNLNNIKLGQTY